MQGRDYHGSHGWQFMVSPDRIEVTQTKACITIRQIVIGECGCGFHLYCMQRWQAGGNIDCPSCGSVWKERHRETL